MPTNKQPKENEPGTLIHGLGRDGRLTGIALPKGVTRAQWAKIYRSTLAKRGGDMLWAVTFEKKKLRADDIQWLREAFYWFRDNPTGGGGHELMVLVDLVESWPGDK